MSRSGAEAASPAPPPAPAPCWRRGWPLAVGAGALTLLLAAHRLVPRAFGVGTLVETFLPWLGLGVPLLALAALRRRAPLVGVATALPAMVWLALFGPALLPHAGEHPSAARDLRVVTHNVRAANRDVPGTAAALVATKADLVALEEVTGANLGGLEQTLDPLYPYHVAKSRVGLWSRYPISSFWRVELSPTAHGAFHAVVTTPEGPVTVYVAHLPRPDVGVRGVSLRQRNSQLDQLAAAIAADPAARLLLVGDFNTAANDRALLRATVGLRSAQADAGTGLGFTWPSILPAIRIDHVFYRGMTALDAGVLSRTGSDHRPVLADLRL